MRAGKVLVALVTAVAVAGCASYSVSVTRSLAPPEPAPARVGVLLFEAESDVMGALGAEGCLSGVTLAGARGVAGPRVAQALRDKGLRTGHLRPEDYRQLGEALGVDAFIAGSLEPPVYGLPGSLSARLVSAKTGALLTTAVVHRSSRGGVILRADELATAGCRVVITGREEEL